MELFTTKKIPSECLVLLLQLATSPRSIPVLMISTTTIHNHDERLMNSESNDLATHEEQTFLVPDEGTDPYSSITSFFSNTSLMDDDLSSISTTTSSSNKSFKLEENNDEDFQQMLSEEIPPEYSTIFKINSNMLHTDVYRVLRITAFLHYFIFLVYAIYFLDLFSTIVFVMTVVAALPQWKNFRSNNKEKRSPEKIFRDERKAVQWGFFLFTVRFVILRKHKVILLPLYLTLVILATKLTNFSVLWSLTPFYFIVTLFTADSLFLIATYGWSEHCLFPLIENVALVVVIFLITYSITTTGIDKKSKMKALEKTSMELKNVVFEKQRFLRSVSHEFRSPCLSSLGSVELLRETELTEYQRDLVDTIASADEILLNLIEDILRVAKSEHQKRFGRQEELQKEKKNLQEFSLGYCVKTIENIIKSYAKPFQVQLEVNIDDTCKNLKVRGNLTRIHQVLANLLTNAVKASKPGDKVQLLCSTDLEEQRTLTSRIEEQTVVFKVIDHGVGIPQEKQKEIFKPFTQLHNVNESVFKGYVSLINQRIILTLFFI